MLFNWIRKKNFLQKLICELRTIFSVLSYVFWNLRSKNIVFSLLLDVTLTIYCTEFLVIPKHIWNCFRFTVPAFESDSPPHQVFTGVTVDVKRSRGVQEADSVGKHERPDGGRVGEGGHATRNSAAALSKSAAWAPDYRQDDGRGFHSHWGKRTI